LFQNKLRGVRIIMQILRDRNWTNQGAASTNFVLNLSKALEDVPNSSNNTVYIYFPQTRSQEVIFIFVSSQSSNSHSFHREQINIFQNHLLPSQQLNLTKMPYLAIIIPQVTEEHRESLLGAWPIISKEMNALPNVVGVSGGQIVAQDGAGVTDFKFLQTIGTSSNMHLSLHIISIKFNTQVPNISQHSQHSKTKKPSKPQNGPSSKMQDTKPEQPAHPPKPCFKSPTFLKMQHRRNTRSSRASR